MHGHIMISNAVCKLLFDSSWLESAPWRQLQVSAKYALMSARWLQGPKRFWVKNIDVF